MPLVFSLVWNFFQNNPPTNSKGRHMLIPHNNPVSRILSFGILFATLLLFSSSATWANNQTIPKNSQKIALDQVDSILAHMSDEQVRSLLIAELSEKKVQSTAPTSAMDGGLIGKTVPLLHLLDQKGSNITPNAGFSNAIQQFPSDYIAMIKKMSEESPGNILNSFLSIIGIFIGSTLLEFLVRRFTANFRAQFQEKAIPDLDGPMRFIAGMMQSIPTFIHIFVNSAAAVLLFLLLPLDSTPQLRYIFLALLLSINFKRIISQISNLFLSPDAQALRVNSLDNSVARSLHRAVVFLCSYTFSAVIFIALMREMHLNPPSLRITILICATLLILFIVSMIFRSRKYVSNSILKRSEENKTRNWVVEQFAQFWHVPTILYFLIIGLFMIADMLSGVQRSNSAFLQSLLLLPLFVLFNNLGQWIVKVSINTLQIAGSAPDSSVEPNIYQQWQDARERERKLYINASRVMSLAILATLLVWVLSLWNVHIPYANSITNAVFESLIALALGLIVWRFSSSYIEKKINESSPKTEDDKKESDDEWGAAATRGRSFTILPMLRKFIATTLLVMVSLVILSALGVDIGPLLAGAGVVGLAIGFGAQKLVSDVFSGFFYLLDDAFRVGEYIQAGSVSGAVESITLRNVMLRHHRGMLQIVPHSELGSITNFMRGGIIVKFNLEFPYDANVDKIRKVIKKVGRAMLEDEEFGKDFIQPVKSAGVREITASVMVIRVKFKAQPGTHFVIRREAYRRITEALAAQGIHYAHRKVIVEMPEQETKNLSEENQKLLKAGAAAALAQQEDDEKKKAQEAQS